MEAILDSDLLVMLEEMYRPHRPTRVILPEPWDVEQAVHMLIQEAIGYHETEQLLLERRILDVERELSSMLGVELRGEDFFAEDVEVPLEGLHLRRNLETLLTELTTLERTLAQLRGPEGQFRADCALAPCEVVPSKAAPRSADTSRERLVLRLTSGSYGLCETMEERLKLRGWGLDLPEGHEETRLRDDERTKWQLSAAGKNQSVQDWPALLRNPPKNLVLAHDLGGPHDPSSIYGREYLTSHADGSLELRVWQGDELHLWQAKSRTPIWSRPLHLWRAKSGSSIWSRWAKVLAESAFPAFPQPETVGGASCRIFTATVGSSSVRAVLSRYHFEDEPPYAGLCGIIDSVCAQIRGRESRSKPGSLVREVRKIEL